jgi:hypothetical protein
MEFVELGDGGFESQLAASNLQPLDDIGDRVSLGIAPLAFWPRAYRPRCRERRYCI